MVCSFCTKRKQFKFLVFLVDLSDIHFEVTSMFLPLNLTIFRARVPSLCEKCTRIWQIQFSKHFQTTGSSLDFRIQAGLCHYRELYRSSRKVCNSTNLRNDFRGLQFTISFDSPPICLLFLSVFATSPPPSLSFSLSCRNTFSLFLRDSGSLSLLSLDALLSLEIWSFPN